MRTWRLTLVGTSVLVLLGYERKRVAGESKVNALGHCMSKALNRVWGVWRNGADWDPEWGLRP